jgi:hypothetical protein
MIRMIWRSAWPMPIVVFPSLWWETPLVIYEARITAAGSFLPHGGAAEI